MSLFVDLTTAPYLVVANDISKAVHNTAAINSAIVDHSGTSARLVLPPGDIYLEQANPNAPATQRTWSVRFGPGVSRLSLAGQGPHATRLIQAGIGTSGQWDGVVVDGASKISLSEFSIEQGTITNRDMGDHHALMGIYASFGVNTNDITVERVYFGPCIGDAFRVGAASGDVNYIDGLRLLDFTMRTQGHPQGAKGLGVGSRSGVSFQRGFQNVEVGSGYIEGAKNNPFEMEPSGVGRLDNLLVHDVIVDNSEGSTRLAFAIAGSVDDPLTRFTLNNVTVLEGAVQCAHTKGMICSNMQIYVSAAAPAPAELTDNSLFFMHQDNQDATISNLHLYRDAGSPSGPLVTVIPTGQATGTITPVAGTGLGDGETFTVSDGVTTKVFELDSNASVGGGRVPVTFTSLDTATQVRDTIVSTINGAGLNLSASNTTTLDPPNPPRPAALLTNKHHGKHGNVPLTATVANPRFHVTGMANGIGGSDGVRFIGGHWVSKVTAGAELRYFEARGCDRVSIEDINLELWANHTKEYGFSFRSIGDVNSPSISNCRIDSRSPTFGATGNKLAAAALFASTNTYQVRDIRVDGLRAANACMTGVQFDRNGGCGIDAYPLLYNCDFTGATNAWSAVNCAAGTVFPVLAGNKGGICTMVGTVCPEGVVTAMQGCEYIRQNGDLTTKYFKSKGTGSTDWSTVTIP